MLLWLTKLVFPLPPREILYMPLNATMYELCIISQACVWQHQQQQNLSSVRLAASTTTESLKRASGSINNNLWKRYEVNLNTKNLCCQFSRMALKRGHFIHHMLCNWRASFDYFSGCDIRDNEALYISLHSIYLQVCSYAFIDVLLYWNANEEKTTRPIETATVLLNVSY